MTEPVEGTSTAPLPIHRGSPGRLSGLGRGLRARDLHAGSVAIVMLGNLVARGLGFLFPVVLAGTMGRPDFALAYFFISTGFAVGELILAGFPVALTRAISASDGRGSSVTIVSAVVGGIPLLVAALLASEVIAATADGPPLLASLVVIGLTIDAYYFAVLRGARSFGLLVLYRIGANLAQLVLLVVAVLAGVATVPVVVAIYALVYLAPIVVIEAVRAPARSMLRGSRRPSRAHLRDLTRIAVPALISGTAYGAVLGLDVFFVRALAGGDLPDYAAARSLAMPMTLFSYAVGVTLLPHVAAAEPAARRRQLRAALVATTVLAGLGVAGYVALGAWVVGLVYPPTFSGASTVLPLLATAIGLTGVYSVLTQWWIGTGRSVQPAICLVLGAGVSAVSHTILTARMGGAGAAASIGVGVGVAIVLLGTWTRRHPDLAAPAG